jgi:AbrB family looped-hinge helix DNA binding protein
VKLGSIVNTPTQSYTCIRHPGSLGPIAWFPVATAVGGSEMATVATTKLSSKGQVVIPEQIRRQLGLETGVQFVAVADGETIVLRVIRPPSPPDYADLAALAEQEAQRRG